MGHPRFRSISFTSYRVWDDKLESLHPAIHNLWLTLIEPLPACTGKRHSFLLGDRDG